MDAAFARGVAAAALSSLIGGTAVVATRFATQEVASLTLILWRYGIGLILLSPLLFAAARPRGRDLLAIALLGLLFFALFPWGFTAALARTTAARGALVLSTVPLLTLIVAVLFGVERFTAPKLAGVLLALAGVAYALFASGRLAGEGPYWQGDLLMLGAVGAGAFYNVLSRPYLRRYAALPFTAWAMAFGFAGIALLTALAGEPFLLPALSWPGWFAVAYLGLFGCAITFFLWSKGLELASPTAVAVTVSLNPVSAMLAGALLLGEAVSSAHVFGLAAVLAGIALVAFSHERRAARVDR